LNTVFYKKFPWLENVAWKNDNGGVLLAGGCVGNFLTNTNINDLDFFFYDFKTTLLNKITSYLLQVTTYDDIQYSQFDGKLNGNNIFTFQYTNQSITNSFNFIVAVSSGCLDYIENEVMRNTAFTFLKNNRYGSVWFDTLTCEIYLYQ